MGDLLLRELPRRERCALGTRPRFIAIDVKLPSLRLRGIHRRGGAADINEGQPAGVAVREDLHSAANQLCAVLPDGLAMPHVFVGKLLRCRQRQCLLLLDRLAGAHGLSHVVHRVNGVNRGGSRGFEGVVNGLDVRQELGQVAAPEGARALGEPIGRGGANRASAAHDHVFDGPGGLAEIARRDDAKFVWQQPLLDEQDGIGPDVERHGAKVSGATVDGGVQAIFTFIFWILLSMVW